MKIIGLIGVILILCSSVAAQEAIKLDVGENITCEEFLSRRDNLRLVLETNPKANAYILIYEGKIHHYNNKSNKKYLLYPHRGEAKEYIRTMHNWMIFARQPLNRIVFVNAGFRENLTVEFWIVPAGATPPKPSPTLTKMKYRKGKPIGFCGDCC